MSRPSQAKALSNSQPWLFATALCSLLPHVPNQASWLTILSLLYLGLAFWLWQAQRRQPGRWLLIPTTLLSAGAIAMHYHSLLGREAGVALCSLFITLKLLELREQRDAWIIIFLAYFLAITHFFQAQDIPTAAWSLGSLLCTLATQIRLHLPQDAAIRLPLHTAGLLMAQALPLTLLLFFLFPRIPGPLWSLPEDAGRARTGLSDTLRPGNISELVQNGEIAFRARFDGQQPLARDLYWRGPVLELFSEEAWRSSSSPGAAPRIEALSPALNYEMTLEAHQQRWLLALDAPLVLPESARLNSKLSALIDTPLEQRQRFTMSASLDYRFNPEEAPEVLTRNLQLPPEINPQTRALAMQWRGLAPDEIIGRALRYLADGGFRYTLRPPRLGRHAIDEFLFIQRSGFCEHYASAFAFMMRSAGLPARIVTGYQGGEWNPQDNYLVVRQSDAHAWTEVWQAKRGWVRVDPTAVVSSRIDQGIGQSLARGEPLPFVLQANWLRDLRYHWEAMNNLWNQAVLGYDADAQRRLLRLLGWPRQDWSGLIQLLILGLLGGSLMLLAWHFRLRRTADPVACLWQKALAELKRSKVDCAPWETPLALAHRVDMCAPWLARDFHAVVEAYLDHRYANKPDYQRLRQAVAQLCSRRKKS